MNLSTRTWLFEGVEREFAFPAELTLEMDEVFSGRAYPSSLLPVEFAPTIIFDVGAHVGSATAYFKQTWPQAQVHCYEPCAGNFALLQKNLHGVSGVYCHQAGWFSMDGQFPLYNAQNSSSGHSLILEKGTAETVPVLSAAREVARLGVPQIPLLKLDAEGAEPHILMDMMAGIENFACLFIFLEYHAGFAMEMIRRLLAPEYEEHIIAQHSPHQGVSLFQNRAFLHTLQTWRSTQRA